MANNYKVKMKDIQNKYKFKIFCAGYEYDDTEIRNAINQRALITETGRYIELELNPNTYVLTAKLKDKNNNLINTSTPIDLPLESMIVDCDYDATTKYLIITLQNGNTTTIPLGDLISGLATEEDLEEMDAKVSANIKKISDLENELNQYKMLENVLPKVEGEGETIHLEDTAKSPMKLNFKGQIKQDGEPTPTNPIDIHLVSGDNEIKVCNKNLFNSNVEVKNAYPSTNVGNMISYKNTTATISYVNCFYVKSGTTYTISYEKNTPSSISQRDSAIVNENNIILESLQLWNNNNTSITFTPTYSGYLVYACDKNTTNIQIEKGSTSTDYVEHKEYTKEIPLGELEVGGIGEYEDEFFKNTINSEYYDSTLLKDKWYLKKRIGKVVLDGSESWVLASSETNTTRFYINIPSITDGLTDTTPSKLLASHFTPQTFNYIYRNDEECIAQYGGTADTSRKRVYIRINNSLATTLVDFKAWLSNNNVELYYVLATFENILLNDTLQETLDSFYSWQEQTNISQENNDLPFVIKASAIYDLSNLVTRVAVLESE